MLYAAVTLEPMIMLPVQNFVCNMLKDSTYEKG